VEEIRIFRKAKGKFRRELSLYLSTFIYHLMISLLFSFSSFSVFRVEVRQLANWQIHSLICIILAIESNKKHTEHKT
jgi:hypothetical protein